MDNADVSIDERKEPLRHRVITFVKVKGYMKGKRNKVAPIAPPAHDALEMENTRKKK